MKNRVKDYFPHLWQKYLDDELERIRQEAKAITGIDPLDFVPVDAAAPVLSPFFSVAELQAQAAVEVQQIIARSKRREARRARKNKPPQ